MIAIIQKFRAIIIVIFRFQMIKSDTKDIYKNAISYKQCSSEFQGVFTPEKSVSSLALVQTKYNVYFCCLVWFAFTLPYLQVNQKL